MGVFVAPVGRITMKYSFNFVQHLFGGHSFLAITLPDSRHEFMFRLDAMDKDTTHAHVVGTHDYYPVGQIVRNNGKLRYHAISPRFPTQNAILARLINDGELMDIHRLDRCRKCGKLLRNKKTRLAGIGEDCAKLEAVPQGETFKGYEPTFLMGIDNRFILASNAPDDPTALQKYYVYDVHEFDINKPFLPQIVGYAPIGFYYHETIWKGVFFNTDIVGVNGDTMNDVIKNMITRYKGWGVWE